MIFNSDSTGRQPERIVQKFGQASLVKRADGTHELWGGSPEDRAAASDWVSLFAHEIVFSRPPRRPRAPRQASSRELCLRFRAVRGPV